MFLGFDCFTFYYHSTLLLDDDIISIELDDSEVKEIIEYICSILHSLLINNNVEQKLSDRAKNIVFGMLRTLEESPSKIALMPTLQLFISCHQYINYEVYNWFVFALDKLISNNLTIEEKNDMLRKTNLISFLQQKLLAINCDLSSSNILKDNIASLLDRLNRGNY